MNKQGLVWFLAAMLGTAVGAQELKPVILPAPQTDGGRPLMQALKERKSTRNSAGEIAGAGAGEFVVGGIWVNRADGRRTAPSQ